jgi:hypothetical protein
MSGWSETFSFGGGAGNLRFENAAYSWAKNIECTQWIGECVASDGSFRVELRDSYIHTASWPEPGGGGYPISLANGSSEFLIENNISIDTTRVIVMRSTGPEVLSATTIWMTGGFTRLRLKTRRTWRVVTMCCLREITVGILPPIIPTVIPYTSRFP